MLLLIAKEESTIGVPFGTKTSPGLIPGHTTRSTTQIGAHGRSASDVMWERYSRLEIWWVLMAAGRAEGDVVWIPARGAGLRLSVL